MRLREKRAADGEDGDREALGARSATRPRGSGRTTMSLRGVSEANDVAIPERMARNRWPCSHRAPARLKPRLGNASPSRRAGPKQLHPERMTVREGPLALRGAQGMPSSLHPNPLEE
jgi:hypothetical protein